MIAYELLARLRHLSLAGQDEYGDLEWIGTYAQWMQVSREEFNFLHPTVTYEGK